MPITRTLDAITVIALTDGEGPFFEPRSAVFPDATPAQWAQADQLDPASVRDGEWWLRFRCYALRLPTGRVIVVDTGIGPANSPAQAWAPVPGRLPQELADAGIQIADVDTVVLTHLHTDHIGWSIDEGAAFFPNARYLLQRNEIDAIDARAPGLAEWLLAPLRAGGHLVAVDGDEALGAGVRIVATPGHTPGHQSVLVETTRQTLVVTGDLLVHMLQLVDPTLRYGHEEDPALARESRTALLHGLTGQGGAVLATPHLGDAFVALP